MRKEACFALVCKAMMVSVLCFALLQNLRMRKEACFALLCDDWEGLCFALPKQLRSIAQVQVVWRWRYSASTTRKIYAVASPISYEFNIESVLLHSDTTHHSLCTYKGAGAGCWSNFFCLVCCMYLSLNLESAD